MELSDFPMKKQIVFGQIWKRLVIIVVDLNYYELILMNILLYFFPDQGSHFEK